MSDVQTIPNEIDNEENIARVVFSPMMIEDGEISPSAFYLRDLRKPEDYVSVFRHDYLIPTVENVSMIHPPKDNIIYGYALLNVGICRKISHKDIMLDVLSHPNQSNPYHAGIHFSKSGIALTGKGSCIDPDFIIVTGMLANNSELIVFPCNPED